MSLEEINQFVIQILSTGLLILLAVEMFIRVFVNTWFEIKELFSKSRKEGDNKAK